MREDRRLVHRFWDRLTLRQMAPLAGGVFCLFAGLGFLVDALQQGRSSPLRLALLVLMSGGVAVGYLLASVRRRYWAFPVLISVQVGISLMLTRLPAPPGPPSDARRALDLSAAIAGLSGGYALVMVFITREGLRRVRTETEIELAREIHEALVPVVEVSGAWCEVYGRSLPAAAVGGDLVDALTVDGRVVAAVADVSGHGVPAGTLMGAVKAALRTRLRAAGHLGEVLADVNDLLVEITRSNTFATAAVLSFEGPTTVAYALGGHPALLHFDCRRGAVERLELRGIALGILAGQVFPVGRVEVGAGDVLAILTDGFTETSDGDDRELGFEPLERVLALHAGDPLPAVFASMVDVARRHGPQLDDRTLLLARVRRA